jgi:hypothetical protein
MLRGHPTDEHPDMPNYFVELNVTGGELELDRAVRMLETAQRRMSGRSAVIPLSTGDRGRDTPRLVCLIEADSPEAAKRLMSVALVPHGPIREVSQRVRDRLLRA